MPLDDQHGRWAQRAEHVRDLLNQLLAAWPADGRMLLNSVLQGAKTALSEFRQQAEADAANGDLGQTVAPLAESLQNFNRVESVSDSDELRQHMTQVRDAAQAVFLKLSDVTSRGDQTVDQVIEDFAIEYRTSLILALTANYALTQTVTRWYESGPGPARDDHLDLRTMQFVPSAGAHTIPMSILATSMSPDPVVITPTNFGESMREMAGGSPPPIFRMAYTQWFATIIAAWEDTYRPRLAAAHGQDAEGVAWTRNDIRSEFFYDLSQLRHDISHHAGACVESAGNTTIDWLQLEAGKLIAPTTPQMLKFLDHFPGDELRRTPIRANRTTRPLPYQFDLAWTEKVADHVTSLEAVKRKRPSVIQRVIDNWMNGTTNPD